MRKYGGSEYSKNKYKKKGFKGHIVKPSQGELAQRMQAGQPRVSNFVRHQMSKANRAVREGKI